MHRSASGGFTLVELMVVLAVIAILASMAIPNFVRSKVAANETSAIASLRTLTTVLEQYQVRFNAYPDALADLAAAGYIDESLGAGTKSGYRFGYTGSAYQYAVNADPETPGASGDRSFYVDSSGVIRWSASGSAGPSDPPVDS